MHTLRNAGTKPVLFSMKGGELSLSGPALVELLSEVLGKGLPFRFRAKGFSMSPFIKEGDVITVSPLRGRLPRFGDVGAFVNSGTERLAVHRIVGKKGNYFLVRGDSGCFLTNDLVSKGEILGRVTKLEREGKEISLGLGAERFVIAFFSRLGLLAHIFPPLWKLARPLFKRMLL